MSQGQSGASGCGPHGCGHCALAQMQPPPDAPAGARLVGRAISALLAPLAAAIIGAAAMGRGPVRQTLGAVLGFCSVALVLFVFFRVWGRTSDREYSHDGIS